MNRILRSTLLLASTSLLFFAPQAARAQVLACGTVVTQSVTLQADVVCPPYMDGLTVGASNITIDLNGYAIVGAWNAFQSPQSFGSAIVSSLFDGVTITNGYIKGFNTPIVLVGGKGHQVYKMEALIDQSYPVILNGTSFSVVENNDFRGIELSSSFTNGSVGNRISGNRLGSGPGGGGGLLEVRECSTYENVVEGNTITGEPGQVAPVVVVRNQAHGINFTGNTIVGSVQFQGASNTFRKNRVSADPTASWAVGVFRDRSADPVFCKIDEGVGNQITDNSITGAFHGIRVQSVSGVGVAHDNLITRNVFSRHSIGGIFFTVSAEDNDGRGNHYSSLPFPVIDHGRGNRWP